jgi:hypothetical protein
MAASNLRKCQQAPMPKSKECGRGVIGWLELIEEDISGYPKVVSCQSLKRKSTRVQRKGYAQSPDSSVGADALRQRYVAVKSNGFRKKKKAER